MQQNSAAIHCWRKYYQKYANNLLITLEQEVKKLTFEQQLGIIAEIKAANNQLSKIADYEFKINQPNSNIISTLEEYLKQN